MDVCSVKDFKNGWFIGDFTPSIYRTPLFEVAHHYHGKGFVGLKHTHRVATESNYIVRGELMASGQHLKTGDVFTYHPHEIADVSFLEDTDLIVVKWPSVPWDKTMI